MKLTLKERIKQLENSALLLKDALDKVEQGKSEYYVILGSQLRALICTGRKNFTPLLFDIAREINYTIDCFGPRSSPPDDPMSKGLVFRLSTRVIGFEPFSPAQRKYKLEEWLETYVLILNGEFYTPNQVLRAYADKEASHYDKATEERLDNLKNLIHHSKDRTVNELEKFLVLTGSFVVKTIQDLVRSTNKS